MTQHNKTLHRTAISLQSIADRELCHYTENKLKRLGYDF